MSIFVYLAILSVLARDDLFWPPCCKVPSLGGNDANMIFGGLPEKVTTVPGLYSSWTPSVGICKKQLSYLPTVARRLYQSDQDWGSWCNGVCRLDIIDRFVYTVNQCSSASCMAGLFSLDHASSFSLACRPAV